MVRYVPCKDMIGCSNHPTASKTLITDHGHSRRMHTKRLGKIGELRVASELLKLGYDVFFPLTEDLPVDLVVCKDNKFHKVQVKTRNPRNGKLPVPNRTNNAINKIKKYSDSDVSVIILYDPENDNGYWIPISEFQGKGMIVLRLTPPKNSQVKGVRYAKDFKIF